MRKLKVIVSTVLIIISLISACQITLANNNLKGVNKTYNFYISTEGLVNDEDTTIFIANSVDENTLVENKIAPGTSGSFEIKVNIAEDVETGYLMRFKNFSSKLPRNLKIYYEGELIDLTTFKIIDIQKSNNASYVFSWVWDYTTETAEKDKIDTIDSLLGDISFDVVLTAAYRSIYCNVYFVDGDTINTEKIERNTNVNEPKTPVKDGYTFLGWVDKDGEIFDFNTPIYEDKYLYATWIEVHSVYFVNGDDTDCSFVENGNKVSEPTKPKKEGYIFEGWVDSDGNFYDFNSPVTSDTILYAKWKKVCKVYFVSETDKDIVEVIEGERVSAIKPPVRNGYSFIGWVDEAGNFFNFNTQITNDLILFAKYERTLPRTGDIKI